jgi:2-polyprenyl-6-methoxyphenol hydroxylase-like FAD-dependent oxidoreductase
MAGLLAAKVLSDFYDRVSLIERDELTDDVVARRGVPQSRQPHALLARCGEIAEELFPGFLDDMVAEGAHRWDDGDLSRFNAVFAGHQIINTGFIPEPSSLINFYASRPFIECHVRRRLRAVPNVDVLDRHELVDLISSGEGVTGVVLHRHADGEVVSLPAQLVVDATGRGSRTPVFLERLGYGKPAEDELPIRVSYASMPVRIPDGTLREHLIARLFEPGRLRAFAMFACERDTWMVGAATMLGAEPPSNREELLDFGIGFFPEYALTAARAAEPLGVVSIHRFPANRWRRYDKMGRTPDGLIVLGDAVCSFNPIYGQGMTVASIEALILRDCLRQGVDGLPRRFHRAAAKKIRLAWQTAAGSDLAFPEVQGKRSLSTRVTNAFADRVLTAAESDPYVAQEFLRVTGMIEEPSRMLRPSFVLRVARGGRGRRRGAVSRSTTPTHVTQAT